MIIQRYIRWENIGDTTYSMKTRCKTDFDSSWREILRIHPNSDFRSLWNCISQEPEICFTFYAPSLEDAKEAMGEFYSTWLYERMWQFDKHLDLCLESDPDAE